MPGLSRHKTKNMKLVKFITGILVITSFAMCTLNEEIDLSTPGKGQYLVHTDMSQALTMMKSMGGGQMPDSLKDKTIDTIISLAAQLDSLDKPLSAEDQAYFKNGKLHMVMNMIENKFTMEMKYPVKDIKDLKNFFKVNQYVDSVNKSKKKEAEPSEAGEEGVPGGGGAPGLSGLSSMMSGMQGKGSPYVITDSSIQRVALTDEALAESMGEQMKGAEMFMSQMIMSATIKLPRPVKRLEGKNVKLQDDKKTVFFTTSFSELKENPENGAFLIVF
jgi:hypothetical protein